MNAMAFSFSFKSGCMLVTALLLPALAEGAARKLSDRAACSSLAACKQPTEVALKKIADLGFRWVDLSCLNWAPHVSVPKLVAGFDQEASRVEAALNASGLKVSNLTFDSYEVCPFTNYTVQFEAVAGLAARLKTRLINIMAPSPKADRHEVVARLKRLVEIASRHEVVLTVETHVGQITEKPADALWLCDQVPGLGLTLDPSHYFAGPNQGANFDALLPHVRGTGLRAGGMSWKDIQMPWGQGPIDFAGLVRKLEAKGYRGFFVAEYIEGFNQLDPLAESRKFLQWCQGL